MFLNPKQATATYYSYENPGPLALVDPTNLPNLFRKVYHESLPHDVALNTIASELEKKEFIVAAWKRHTHKIRVKVSHEPSSPGGTAPPSDLLEELPAATKKMLRLCFFDPEEFKQEFNDTLASRAICLNAKWTPYYKTPDGDLTEVAYQAEFAGWAINLGDPVPPTPQRPAHVATADRERDLR